MAQSVGSLSRVASRAIQAGAQRCGLSSVSSSDVWHLGLVAPALSDSMGHTHQEVGSCGIPAHVRHLHSQSNPRSASPYHPHVSYRPQPEVRLCAATSHPFHGVVVSDVEHSGMMKQMIEDAKRQRELFTAHRQTGATSSHYSEASLGSVESDEIRRNIWTTTAPIETLLEMSLA